MREFGPLTGLTVVELSVHRAGPYCGALLADLGADVIKVERPGTGDPSRSQGVGPVGQSGYFIANNRNKRSVTIDLKSEAGTEAALELMGDADVIVENFGYGVTDRLGVGYESVVEVNPEVVYASIKGYGETGPSKEKPGMDLVLQAEGGIMSVTGPSGGKPVKVGQAIGDLTAGMHAVIGILAKLHERDDPSGSGEFQGKLDVGLFGAIVSVMNEYLTFHSMNGMVPGPQGVTHQSIVPYQLFNTSDGEIVLAVPSDQRWMEFVDLIGREELTEYPTNQERYENRAEVTAVIQEEIEKESTAYWTEKLTEAGFPNGPVNDVADVINHPQTHARELIETITDPEAGEVIVPRQPVHYPETDTSIRRPAPRLGEHTTEVFQGVADSQTTLDDWEEAGAFGTMD